MYTTSDYYWDLGGLGVHTFRLFFGLMKMIKVGDSIRTNEGYVVVVTHIANNKNIKIQFENGQSTTVTSQNLRKGQVKNPFHPSVVGVGFNGKGKYKPTVNRKITLAYQTWRDILRRCYCPAQQRRNQSYIGCSVDTSWHNFQIFAEWFYANYKTGMHIDKDLIKRGNRVYCSDFCSFVPPEINSLIKTSRGNDKDGVHSQDGFYIAFVTKYGIKTYLGCFKSYNEAANVYRKEKETHVKLMAEKYKSEIDPRVYSYLKSWKLSACREDQQRF